LVDSGDEVLVGDPMYATYEAVIRASGAQVVPVTLRPEHGFRMQASDLSEKITARSRVVFLNSPHNPTGSILTSEDIVAIGALAKAHNLWIVCDEVYEDLIFDGTMFASPLDDPSLDDRVIVACSISKSHAAAGFRSGWCIGPKEFTQRLLPLSETMLFGNQPFIADMTALALSAPSEVAKGMRERFARRADLLVTRLHGVAGLKVHRPQAGMFALVNIRATGLSGEAFAERLLDEALVAVMPGESFGPALSGWLRLALSTTDTEIDRACDRIIAFTQDLLTGDK
ncbi:MAG: pyridoxal phosphate-dependent aminotransferase, partial [Paracoccaceae bacterium]